MQRKCWSTERGAMNEITVKKRLTPGIHYFEVKNPDIAKRAKAGQFVIVRISEEGERIPLTIADFNRDKGLVTLVVMSVGKTTLQMETLNKGDRILDLVGPLGLPTHIEHYGKVACIGGGVGIAPIYPITRALKEAGNYVIGILGARTRELLIFEDRMKAICDELIITTDDGSYGRKGFVTDALKDYVDSYGKVDKVFAIGPVPMMKNVCKLTRECSISTIVSLNAIMVDGTGMCGSCRVTVGGKTKFSCVEGPDFDGHLVDFDELASRQCFYREEEIKSLNIYNEKIGGGCRCKDA